MFQFLPAIGGMMEGLLGGASAAGGAGGMAGGGMMQAGAAPSAVGNAASVIGNIGGNQGGGDIANIVANAADSVSKVGQMPSVGGMTSNGQSGPALPGLMQAQAPGHQNDPLMQGGGMWQKIFGGGI